MSNKYPNSNYTSSGLAQTYDQKSSKPIQGMGNGIQTASATSLTIGQYAVPSMDGRLMQAEPYRMALKFKPPTIIVVYKMKDGRSGKIKKYIHDIQIEFNSKDPGSIVPSQLYDQIIKKEATYLNPEFIKKQQVSQFKFSYFIISNIL
jgi:hypothetical protein|tara:strand:- start:1065 stop:1508 length:444 start_codon:yes stop_codon:yes gene_type:complete